MNNTNRQLLLAALIALLGVFLFVGSVSADDGGTGTPATQPTVVALGTSTQTTDAVVPVTDTPVAAVTVDASAPEVTATPVVTTTDDAAATLVAPTAEDTSTSVDTSPTGDTSTPVAEVSAVDTTTEDPTAAVTTTPEGTSTPDAVVTEAATAAPTTDVSPLTVSPAGDPYFMVGAVKYMFETVCPTPGPGFVCTVSTTPITAAINYIQGNGLIPTDKKVYVEQGTYTESVTIDGSSSVPLSQLTGLIGVDGSALTIINGKVTVKSTTGGFTLSGFTINNAVDLENNKGTATLSDLVVKGSSADGIDVTNQQGAITVNNVASNGNFENGADLDNSGSSTAYAVTVSGSEFDDNGIVGPPTYFGLNISTNGAITIDGSTFSRNYGDGLDLYPGKAAPITISNSILSGNTSSYGALGNGLYVETTSALGPAVTLSNVQADQNSGVGMFITSAGAFTGSQLTANDNVNRGLYLTSTYAPSSVSLSNSTFSDNGLGTTPYEGMTIYSKGAITLTFVSADGNGAFGAYLDNCLVSSGTCTGNGTVTLLNPNLVSATFSNNLDGNGLSIFSSGAVTVTGVTANSNPGIGLIIKNNYTGKTGGVTINTYAGGFTTDYSSFTDNGGVGVEILSNGSVSINGQINSVIAATFNTGYDFEIGSDTAPIGGTVTLKELAVTANCQYFVGRAGLCQRQHFVDRCRRILLVA